MARNCPKCASKLGFIQLNIPRFSLYFVCPFCNAKMEFEGIFYWGSEFALFIVSISVYFALGSSWIESAVAAVFAGLFYWFQYKFANIRLVKT